MTDGAKKTTYRDAGVDIDAGNALVERIKPAVAATKRAGVASALGGFGGLFDPRAAGFSDPVLVAATDGVGTKLRLAIELGQLETVGIDLVAMCVNDLICQGAQPLFFLDYFATGKLDVDEAAAVIEGIAAGCRAAGCALLGGETAEMPGMYAPGDFDLAGFAVGAMERGQSLPKAILEGTALIGLRSSGVHSNGYSLVRRLVAQSGLGWDAPFEDTTLGAALLAPTRLYVQPLLPLIAAGDVLGLAHITGGGISENLPRMLPDGVGAHVDLGTWDLPALFGWLQEQAGVDADEMLRTFNCGIGMILAVPEARAEAVCAALGADAVRIGTTEAGQGVRYSGTL